MYVRKSDLNDNIQPGTPISVLTNKWSIGNPIELLPDGNYSKRHDGSLRVGADFYPIKTGYKIICPALHKI
jgi:hypothetical protein